MNFLKHLFKNDKNDKDIHHDVNEEEKARRPGIQLDESARIMYEKIMKESLATHLPAIAVNSNPLIIGVGGSRKNIFSALRDNGNVHCRLMYIGGYIQDSFGDIEYFIPEKWPGSYWRKSFPEGFEDDLKNFIKAEVDHSHINQIFVVSGLGKRGTGSRLTKTVIQLIKELNLPCICIISLPFFFQGNEAVSTSLRKFSEIREVSARTLCFPLHEIANINGEYTLLDAFKIADLWMVKAIDNIINGSESQTIGKILSMVTQVYKSTIVPDNSETKFYWL